MFDPAYTACALGEGTIRYCLVGEWRSHETVFAAMLAVSLRHCVLGCPAESRSILPEAISGYN
jgi:hypothetical protein